MKQTRLRILLPIMLVHLLAIPMLVYQFLERIEEPVWEFQKSLGVGVARDIGARIAVRQHGVSDVHEVKRTVEELLPAYGLRSLSVYRSDGTLVAWGGPSRPGPVYGSDRAELRPAENALQVTHWVKNEGPCRECHTEPKPFIGVIDLSLPLSVTVARVESERKRAVLVTFILLTGVFVLVFLSHYYFVSKPVQEIVTAMGKVREGDLNTRLPVIRKDELGDMARSFNKVVDSLREAKAELERRHEADMYRAEQLATVGEIAAGLAHEVKNPLAGISSALEVVLAETDEGFPHRDVLGQMLEETKRINLIINRLLDYARPPESRPDWCDVQMLVKDLQGIFAPQCQRARVDFTVRAGVDSDWLYVDGQELRQVLINVLRNSLEAVGRGGKVELGVETTPADVSFVISDNGPGIDPSTRNKIFQPFYTTKPGGTGLGLAIVQRLVKNMSGSIEVDSQPGRGTRFTIRVPKRNQDEAPDRR